MWFETCVLENVLEQMYLKKKRIRISTCIIIMHALYIYYFILLSTGIKRGSLIEVN